jgi:hypothetical protein
MVRPPALRCSPHARFVRDLGRKRAGPGAGRLLKLVDRGGPAKQVALQLRAVLAAEELRLGRRFHPFGDDRNVQAAAKSEDRPNDAFSLRMAADAIDEGAIR